MNDYLQCMMEIREELHEKNEKEYVKNPLKYKLTQKVSNCDFVTSFNQELEELGDDICTENWIKEGKKTLE